MKRRNNVNGTLAAEALVRAHEEERERRELLRISEEELQEAIQGDWDAAFALVPAIEEAAAALPTEIAERVLALCNEARCMECLLTEEPGRHQPDEEIEYQLHHLYDFLVGQPPLGAS